MWQLKFSYDGRNWMTGLTDKIVSSTDSATVVFHRVRYRVPTPDGGMVREIPQLELDTRFASYNAVPCVRPSWYQNNEQHPKH